MGRDELQCGYAKHMRDWVRFSPEPPSMKNTLAASHHPLSFVDLCTNYERKVLDNAVRSAMTVLNNQLLFILLKTDSALFSQNAMTCLHDSVVVTTSASMTWHLPCVFSVDLACYSGGWWMPPADSRSSHDVSQSGPTAVQAEDKRH
jgi:hypothetical protein